MDEPEETLHIAFFCGDTSNFGKRRNKKKGDYDIVKVRARTMEGAWGKAAKEFGKLGWSLDEPMYIVGHVV